MIHLRDFIILTDTRQQKEKHITKEFDKQGIKHIRTGLPSADYMALRYDGGFVFDYSVLIDTKKDLLELCGNLCRNSEHERVKREIKKARELGCKEFIFLIAENKIKTTNDIKKWRSRYTKVKGETLLKVMKTMAKKYKVKFIICPRNKIGSKIIEIFSKI